jgi:hypothetical protein
MWYDVTIQDQKTSKLECKGYGDAATGGCRCNVFMAADRVWAEFLQHAEQYLSVPQFVTVVSAMAETGAGLEEVCHSQPPS